jgi:hypothetical protein
MARRPSPPPPQPPGPGSPAQPGYRAHAAPALVYDMNGGQVPADGDHVRIPVSGGPRSSPDGVRLRVDVLASVRSGVAAAQLGAAVSSQPGLTD